jgi:hypothetical protein
MKILIPIAILIACCISSCYYDSKEYLFPQLTSGCDTTNITFTLSVIPILNNHCLSCHSNSTAAANGANIRLENYTDVKARVDDGKLWGSISYATGFSPMPKGSSKLNECKLSIVQKWIDNGAPNN